MTSHYRRGADFERLCVKALEAQGAIHVVRSAGSKGPVDIVAFYDKTFAGFPRIGFVQCKRGKITKADRWALIELAHQCGAIPVLATPGGRGQPIVFQVLQREAA